eukprot:Nk52_evm10s914 gene=Nk52_evmTU10s914
MVGYLTNRKLNGMHHMNHAGEGRVPNIFRLSTVVTVVMSWAKDAWKADLPSNALTKITELENEIEALKKDCSQKVFQNESLNLAFEKQKARLSEEVTKISELERAASFLQAKLEESEKTREKLKGDLVNKENSLSSLSASMGNANTRLEILEKKQREWNQSTANSQDRICELERELESLQKENQRMRELQAQPNENRCNKAEKNENVNIGIGNNEELKLFAKENNELKNRICNLTSVLEQKEQKMESIESEIASVRCELKASMDNCAKLENVKEDYETIKTSLQISTEQFEKQVSMLKAQNEGYCNKISELMIKSNEQMQDTKSKGDELAEEVRESGRKLTNIIASLNSSSVPEALSSIADLKAVKEKWTKVNKEMPALRKEVDSVRKENVDLNDTVRGLKAKLCSAEDVNAVLKKGENCLKMDIEKLNRELDAKSANEEVLQMDMDETAKAYEELLCAKENILMEADSLRKKMTLVEESNCQLKATIERLQLKVEMTSESAGPLIPSEDKDDVNFVINQLRKDLDGKTSAELSLRSELENLHETHRKLEDECESLKTENSLRDENFQLTLSKAKMCGEIGRKQQEDEILSLSLDAIKAEEFRAKCTDLENQLHLAKTGLEGFEKQIKALEEKLNESRKENESLKANMDMLNMDLEDISASLKDLEIQKEAADIKISKLSSELEAARDNYIGLKEERDETVEKLMVELATKTSSMQTEIECQLKNALENSNLVLGLQKEVSDKASLNEAVASDLKEVKGKLASSLIELDNSRKDFESLKASFANLEMSKNDVQHLLEKSQKEYCLKEEALENQLRSAREEQEVARRELEAVKCSHKNDLIDSVRKSDEEINRLTNCVKELESINSEILEKREIEARSLKSSEEQQEYLSETVRKMKDNLSEEKNKRECLAQEFSDKIEALTTERNELQTRLDDVQQSTVKSEDEFKARLNSQEVELLAKMKALEDGLSMAENKCNWLQEEIESVRNEHEKISKEKDDAEKLVWDLKEKEKELESRLCVSEKALVEFEGSSKRTADELNQEINELKSSGVCKDKDLGNLQKEVERQKEMCTQLKAQLDGARNKLEMALSDGAENEDCIFELNGKIEALGRAKDLLEENERSLKSQVGCLSSEISFLKDQLLRASEEQCENIAELKKSKGEIDKMAFENEKLKNEKEIVEEARLTIEKKVDDFSSMLELTRREHAGLIKSKNDEIENLVIAKDSADVKASELNEELINVKNTIRMEHESLLCLEAKVAQLEKDYENKSSETNECRAVLDETRSKLSASESNLSFIRKELGAQTKSAELLKGELDEYKGQVTALQSELEIHKNDVLVNSAKVKELPLTIRGLEGKVATLENRNEELVELLKESESKGPCETGSVLKDENERLLKELEGARNETEEIKIDFDHFMKTSALKDEENSKMLQKYHTLIVKVKKMEKKLAASNNATGGVCEESSDSSGKRASKEEKSDSEPETTAEHVDSLLPRLDLDAVNAKSPSVDVKDSTPSLYERSALGSDSFTPAKASESSSGIKTFLNPELASMFSASPSVSEFGSESPFSSKNCAWKEENQKDDECLHEDKKIEPNPALPEKNKFMELPKKKVNVNSFKKFNFTSKTSGRVPLGENKRDNSLDE